MSDTRSFNSEALKNDAMDSISEKNDETCTLDIDELELPPIEHLPSLNDILNEVDTGNGFDFSLEFNDIVLGNGEAPGALAFDDRSDISSISASTSNTSVTRKSFRNTERTKRIAKSLVSKSDILRRTKLRAISNQIASAKEQVNAGSPTAIAVCEKYVGVGTSHGLVLVFAGGGDSQQVLKCCLGSTSNVLESGGVAALDFNISGTKLLIGYANGWVHLYDLQTAKLVQRLSDAHPPGYSILHVKFCTVEGGTAALNDSGGSVFELTFGRVTRSSSSRCIFSGSRGEVCNIAPLLIPNIYKKQCNHYADPILLAMASLTKVIVVRLMPATRVVVAFPLAGKPESSPLLCWQFTHVQITEKNRIVDPVLTFARDNVIYSYQLHTSDGEKFRAFAMHKIDFRPESSLVSEEMPMLLNMQWLNYRYLLLVDAAEKLYLYEPGGGVGNECCLEVCDISQVKLVYGSSPFKALVTGGNVSKALACMASKVCYHSLVVLNNQALVLGCDAVYSISMRTWLERVDGLVQADDFPGAVRLVLDFYTGRRKLGAGVAVNNQKSGSEKWRAIVSDKGVHLLLNYIDNAMMNKPESAMEQFKTSIPLCIEACVTLEREDVLYDIIYPRFSVDQMAKSIFLECLDDYIANNLLTNLPPAIVQDYFYHLEKEGLYGAIESSVVRLPVTCLDLHQVMTLCRTHNLYDGIIYIFNRALLDFLTPLKEMMASLVRVISERDLLTDEDIRLGNKVLLYISCCLCGQMYPVGNLELSDAKRVATEVCDFICVRESTETGIVSIFPYLHCLLKFDCREFLNVLTMAFGNHCLDIDEQQRLIDILGQIMLDDTAWMPFQTGALFTFIMRQVVVRSEDISVSRDHFRQLLQVVFRGKLESIGTCSFEERQQALIEFLHSGKSSDLVDENEVLSLAEKGQYFQVCEILYGRKRQFAKIVDCYAKDAFRKEQIFDYVSDLLCDEKLTNDEKATVKLSFLNHVAECGGLNVQRCAEILLRFFPDSLLDICEKLEKTGGSFLVTLLKALFEIRHSSGQQGFVENRTQDQKLAEMFCQHLCESNDFDELLRVLMVNGDFCTNEVFRISKQHRATKAVAYMLEQKGRLEDAFMTIYEDIEDAVKSRASDGTRFESLVSIASAFLKEKCSRIPKEQREGLWFKLLTLLMNLSVEENPDTLDVRSVIVKLVHEMIHFVNPSHLLPKLLDHPLFHGGSYAEFHDLIDGILSGYSYDEVLLSKLVSCIYGEIHQESVRLRKLLSAGLRSNRLDECSSCGQALTTNNDRPAIVFECAHSYHSDCLRARNSFLIDRHSVQEWLCAVCNKKNTMIGKKSALPANGAIPSSEKQSVGSAQNLNSSTPHVHNPSSSVHLSKFEALQELDAIGTKQRNMSRQRPVSNFDCSLSLAPPRI